MVMFAAASSVTLLDVLMKSRTLLLGSSDLLDTSAADPDNSRMGAVPKSSAAPGVEV